MESSLDKAYVMAQLRRSSEFGLFKEAVSIVAGEGMSTSIDWHRIRLDLDRILPGITEPQSAFRSGPVFNCGIKESGGYPACLGPVRLRSAAIR